MTNKTLGEADGVAGQSGSAFPRGRKHRIAPTLAIVTVCGVSLLLCATFAPAPRAQRAEAARNALGASPTPSATAAGGGLSAPAGGAAGGSSLAAQLMTDLVQAGDLGDYTAVGSSANSAPQLCGMAIEALSPAAAQAFQIEVAVEFIDNAASQTTVRVSVASFAGVDGATTLMQRTVALHANQAIAGSPALLLDDQPAGTSCALVQHDQLVAAVMVSAGDSQAAAGIAQQVMLLQYARLEDPAAPHATASPVVLPAASVTPVSSASPPSSNSDEDPPQPSLY